MCIVNILIKKKKKDYGIQEADIKKLQGAGFYTVDAIAYSPRKSLLAIKGLSEPKVDKIMKEGISIYICIYTNKKTYLKK